MKTSFAIHALFYLQYKKSFINFEEWGKVNQDNLHTTNKQGITTQLFLAIFFKGNEIIVCKLQTIVFRREGEFWKLL